MLSPMATEHSETFYRAFDKTTGFIILNGFNKMKKDA